jgi:hypothetical protein
MANVSEIINVSITVQDASATAENFGTIMILADAPFLAGTVQTYDCNPDGLTAMVTAGFNLGDAAKLMADIMAQQNATVPSFKVFSRSNSESQSVNVTPTNTTEGYEYSLGVRGVNGTVTTLEYTVQAADTVADVIDGLIASGTPNGVTFTDNTTDFDITPTASGTRFHLSGIDTALTVVDESTSGDIAADLALAIAADPDFYGVLIDSNEKSEIVAAAAWCATNKKIMLGLSFDSEIANSGVSDDVVSTIVATSNNYANVFYTYDHDGYVNAGLLAKAFAKDPGSSTWAHQTISGPTVDPFTATVHANVRAKNAQTYETYKGLNLTYDGSAASGRFFDITRGTDWLQSIIESALISFIANQSDASKVKFTDVGIGQIEGVIRGQLALAAGVDFIESDFTVSVPKAADVSTANKIARTLTGVTFEANLSGAIHSVTVRGTLVI